MSDLLILSWENLFLAIFIDTIPYHSTKRRFLDVVLLSIIVIQKDCESVFKLNTTVDTPCVNFEKPEEISLDRDNHWPMKPKHVSH